eukprot:scaffold64531_cov36-Phaeocystis_antarctica.AAC.1
MVEVATGKKVTSKAGDKVLADARAKAGVVTATAKQVGKMQSTKVKQAARALLPKPQPFDQEQVRLRASLVRVRVRVRYACSWVNPNPNPDQARLRSGSARRQRVALVSQATGGFLVAEPPPHKFELFLRGDEAALSQRAVFTLPIAIFLLPAGERAQAFPLGRVRPSAPRASLGRVWRPWEARHSHREREAGPLGAQPPPRVLQLAATKAAESAAFDYPGRQIWRDHGPRHHGAAQPVHAQALLARRARRVHGHAHAPEEAPHRPAWRRGAPPQAAAQANQDCRVGDRGAGPAPRRVGQGVAHLHRQRMGRSGACARGREMGKCLKGS